MRLAPALSIAALLLVGSGCGKPVLRLADASLGDYYTDKEFKKLSQEQRDEYCRDLADQRESYLAQIVDSREALEAIQLGAPARRAEIDSLKARAARLEERVRAERAGNGGPRSTATGGGATAPAKTDAGTYVVKPGDSLWRISGLEEVLGRATDWSRLYEANRGLISNPDRIYPGQEIQIPR